MSPERSPGGPGETPPGTREGPRVHQAHVHSEARLTAGHPRSVSCTCCPEDAGSRDSGRSDTMTLEFCGQAQVVLQDGGEPGDLSGEALLPRLWPIHSLLLCI